MKKSMKQDNGHSFCEGCSDNRPGGRCHGKVYRECGGYMPRVCRLGTGEGQPCTDDCINDKDGRCPLLPGRDD